MGRQQVGGDSVDYHYLRVDATGTAHGVAFGDRKICRREGRKAGDQAVIIR